ncbi:MobV family relaxase [Niallia sp. FSL K6-0077]|uniref:MobV family relaxase n=1 Tax=Niallia sp. FSL K6-0077 TaxID=2954743 RepID=UPI0030F66BB9
MSYLVARMQKMKSQNLGGIQRHNQREFENHSNKEIDVSRSHLNFDLFNHENIDYRDRIMNIIEEQKEGSRAIRKDAVLVNEWIITSDKKFFEGLDQEQTKKFFTTAAEFFEERYGKQNIAYGQVHLDETTPHMHLGVVPMREGKLQAKNVFNRKELLAIQDDLPRFLEKKGFDVERGEPNGERKHLTVDEFKDMHSRMTEMAQIEEEREKRIKSLEKEKEALERRIKTSKEHIEDKHAPQKPVGKQQVNLKNGQSMTVYLVPEVEMVRMDGIRKASNDVLKENKRLESENKLLKAKISVLERAQIQISNILKQAQKHASRIAEGVFERAITYAKQFHRGTPSEEKVKDRILEDVKESPEGLQDYEKWEKRKREFEKNRHLER